MIRKRERISSLGFGARARSKAAGLRVSRLCQLRQCAAGRSWSPLINSQPAELPELFTAYPVLKLQVGGKMKAVSLRWLSRFLSRPSTSMQLLLAA